MHIAYTPVFVSDLAVALHFYIEKLGFEKRPDGRFADWVPLAAAVAPPTRETNLLLIQDNRPAATAMNPFIVISVHNIDMEHERLSAAGVPFMESPTERRSGKQARFTDPDGNIYLLVQEGEA
jgi:catechol 2,3-dioxygenase-like lactoylglutathione lyase family enzyme